MAFIMRLLAQVSREMLARNRMYEYHAGTSVYIVVCYSPCFVTVLFCSIAVTPSFELTDLIEARNVSDARMTACIIWCQKRFDFLLTCASCAISMGPMHTKSPQPHDTSENRPSSSGTSCISLLLTEKAAAVSLASARFSDSITLTQSLITTDKAIEAETGENLDIIMTPVHGTCVRHDIILHPHACVVGRPAAERNAEALSRSLTELCRSVAEIAYNSTGVQAYVACSVRLFGCFSVIPSP